MVVSLFEKECPGLAGSIARLLGSEAVEQLGRDYEVTAAAGGNDELGVAREDGVSFNPRIARIVSLVIQECGRVDTRMLRVAMYSSISICEGGNHVIPVALAQDVKAVHGASVESESWIQGIALVLILDHIRHLHMTTMSAKEQKDLIGRTERSELLSSSSIAPEAIRNKVAHALHLQKRRLESVTGA